MKIKYLVEPKPHCLIWCNCHGFLGDVCKQSTNTLLLYLNRCFRYLDFWCFPPYRWTQISELSPPHIFQTDSLHVEEKNVSIFFTSDLFSCWGSRMFERHAYTPDTESFTSVATVIPSRWPISKMTLIFFLQTWMIAFCILNSNTSGVVLTDGLDAIDPSELRWRH